jgi:hypothetical protein
MYLGNNAALLGCQEYFNRAAAAGSPIGATQTPTAYDNAASFNGTNQFLSVASNSTLQSGAGDFTFSLWLRLSTASGVQIHLNKGGSATLAEYILWTNGGTLNFQVVDTAGTNANFAQSSITLVANTWYHVVGSYVASSRVSSVRVNDSASNSGASNPNAANQGSLAFEIGARLSAQYSSASIASVGFWKRALTASEVTALFNSGAGRTYASLDTGLRNNLVSWWALNQNSVTADSHGTNTLTNNGSVTAPNIGPVVTSLADPRQLIIDFAQGIDRLGLWNSMVCWPLRASQNAGSGTTAFSLGGLGQFNGTLVNAPTWGSDGMLFAKNATNWMSFPERTLSYPFCYSAAVINGAIADASPVLYKSAPLGLAISLNRLELVMAINSVAITLNTTYAPWNTPNQAVLMNSRVTGNTSMFVSANGGSETAQTPTSQRYDLAPVDRLSGARGLETTRIAFALLTSGASVPNAALYALYRQTLGLGLNLP